MQVVLEKMARALKVFLLDARLNEHIKAIDPKSLEQAQSAVESYDLAKRRIPEQVMYAPFFDLVADPKNWKNPIDCKVDAPSSPEDRKLFSQMISRAVVFYTGSVPVILDLGDKQIGVKSVGYYEAVGA
jgi:hypothetical protein